MSSQNVMLITGSRKGIGRRLVEYYTGKGWQVVGCSRKSAEDFKGYRHICLDVSDEKAVKDLFAMIRKEYGRLDVLVNNAGVASMNHSLLTSMETVQKVLNTNVVGTFLFCREAAKLMKKHKTGRIVNFSTVAVPLKLQGEAIYASSKAAVVSLTQVLAGEFAEYGITVNAIGPTPVKTDLINAVPDEKIADLLKQQIIGRLGTFDDIINVMDFFLNPASGFITGQVIYLGGVSG
ncbi:MAG: SDR family oxidoreductase [Candidatus Omnitrophica bacterium]|nr:SDR family oxidoreductase [Candidatus Omnitrophota bacterium]